MSNKVQDNFRCNYCGTRFTSIFEVVDHLLEKSGKSFNPKMIISNTFALEIGRILRDVYKYRNNPDKIDEIVQPAFGALWAAEKDPSKIQEVTDKITCTLSRDVWKRDC